VSVDRFFIKRASLATILPAVAGPAIGGFAGKALGPRLGLSPDIGALLGGVTGGVTGGLLKEKAEDAEATVPPGAPYNLDATMSDIPPWALQGARMIGPKMAGHFGDIVGGDLGGLAWPVAQGVHEKQPASEIAKNVAGQGLGTLGGGLVGHGVGHVIDKLVGHPVVGPLGVPLSTMLAGLGATIGNVKGLELARGTQQGA
jgi:hypothetical protein